MVRVFVFLIQLAFKVTLFFGISKEFSPSAMVTPVGVQPLKV